MKALIQLHENIDQRVQQIRAVEADWLCAKGCAQCCRSLADIPPLTSTEWDWLQQGLVALSEAQLQAIAERMAAMHEQSGRPYTCPMLDQAQNSCMVYLSRPVACRTYGFYAQRDGSLYCKDIEQQADAGLLSEVVWGNHEAVERQLAQLGEIRPLTEWFAQWRAESA